MSKSLLNIGILVALFFAAGCQNTVNTVENDAKSAQPNYIQDRRFVTDGFLYRRLRLLSVNVGQAPEGNTTVEVSAVNMRVTGAAQIWSWWTREDPYPVDYKFSWVDEQGMTVETPLSIWKRVLVYPGETVHFKAVAPDLRCKDFVLNLKEADRH
ncbi:MAG: YcfL family protein [Victivallales bacterium]|nr:YcfL family protein [Victivallales bacterium]